MLALGGLPHVLAQADTENPGWGVVGPLLRYFQALRLRELAAEVDEKWTMFYFSGRVEFDDDFVKRFTCILKGFCRSVRHGGVDFLPGLCEHCGLQTEAFTAFCREP